MPSEFGQQIFFQSLNFKYSVVIPVFPSRVVEGVDDVAMTSAHGDSRSFVNALVREVGDDLPSVKTLHLRDYNIVRDVVFEFKGRITAVTTAEIELWV